MAFAVGITAVSGERAELLAQTKADIAAAGFDRHFISWDDFDRRIGPYGNFRRCLSALADSDAEWFIVFQDDIRIAANLRPWLESQELPGDVISLYTASVYDQKGWFRLNPCEGKRAYGALALMLRRETALEFLAKPPNTECLTRTCFWLAEWCKRTGRDYWLHGPSMVMHAGEASLVNPELDLAEACRPFRQAGAWRRDAMDSLSVVAVFGAAMAENPQEPC